MSRISSAFKCIYKEHFVLETLQNEIEQVLKKATLFFIVAITVSKIESARQSSKDFSAIK